jgi:hypothetical protein
VADLALHLVDLPLRLRHMLQKRLIILHHQSSLVGILVSGSIPKRQSRFLSEIVRSIVPDLDGLIADGPRSMTMSF